MADNGNRRSNDFRSRNNRRRREPPIIDGSATQIPVDPEVSAEQEPRGEDVMAEAAPVEPAADPVLFGGALRPAEAAAPGSTELRVAGDESSAADREPEVVPSALDGEPAPGEPIAPTPPPAAEADAEPAAAEAPEGEEPAAPAEPVLASQPAATPDFATFAEPPVPPEPVAATPRDPEGEALRPAAAETPASVPPAGVAAARSAGGAAWLLGLSNLVLLGALAWVLYTGQKNEETPKLQGDVASLGQRLGAADADRQTLAKSVADVSARLDAVSQAAQSARAEAGRASSTAGAAQSDANRPAPTGDAAPATVGALASLSAKLDGIAGRVSALSADQTKTAKAVTDLPKPVPPDFGPTDAKLAALGAALTAVDAKANGADARLNGFETRVNAVDAKANGFDAKINGFDASINGFDARANRIDARANALESKETDEAAGIDKLQRAVAGLPKIDLGPLQAATAALTSGQAAQAAALDKLRGTVAALPKIDIGPLQAATGTLDKRVAGIEAQLSAPTGRARATSIAVVAGAVSRAVADGRPYAPEADALKALDADPDALAKLQPLAAGGAPSAAALKAQWDAVRGDVLAAVKPATRGSSLDQLGANMLSLVQVHQIGAVRGDDPGAVVSQVDTALDAGDVAGALAAWDKLPSAGQDRSRGWAAAARARLDAASAAQALVSRSMATLGKAND